MIWTHRRRWAKPPVDLNPRCSLQHRRRTLNIFFYQIESLPWTCNEGEWKECPDIGHFECNINFRWWKLSLQCNALIPAVKDISFKKYQQIQSKQRHYVEKVSTNPKKTCIFRADRRQDKPSLLLNHIGFLHKLEEEKLLNWYKGSEIKLRPLFPQLSHKYHAFDGTFPFLTHLTEGLGKPAAWQEISTRDPSSTWSASCWSAWKSWCC